MATPNGKVPQAREADLLIHELTGETLVYDLTRHRAHRLNPTAALVWRHCDGDTTVAEMATLLQRELGTPVDEDVVWMVLRRLGKAHLLQTAVVMPADGVHCSRRQLMRKLGMAGGVALVASIVAPTAARAATCLPGGAPCTTDAQCCSNKCLGNNTCKAV
jgi:Coenzyme PQQ synthesis protein D (PqqD)/UPF0506